MSEPKASEPKMVTTAVIISLVAGILIILGSFYADSLFVTIEEIGMIIGVVSGILVLVSASCSRFVLEKVTAAYACAVYGGEV